MTSISDLSLGLPSDIQADVASINEGADGLDRLCRTMLGDSETVDAGFRASAGEFTDLIAWDIVTAASTELMAWEEAAKSLTYGAATFRLWAGDIKDYRLARAGLERRWEEAVSNAKAAVSRIGSRPDMHGSLTSGVFETAKVEELEALRADLLSEHTKHWDTLMDRADQTKKDLRDGPGQSTLERLLGAGLLTGAQLSRFSDTVPGMAPDLPAEGESPAVVGLWWSSMTEEEQRQAMKEHGELLRALDGIPVTVRDELNRGLLQEEISRLEEEVAEAEEWRDAAMGPWPTGGAWGTYHAMKGLEDVQGELDTLTTLRSRLEDPNADRYLLSLDTEGRGRAIVSSGNPDTADGVATLVPGTTTTWQSVNGLIGRADALLESATDADEDGEHAVVTWVGYDAPNFVEAAFSGRAEGAVDELSGFQEGLRVTHQNTSPSHNTVIGHSYGSTVVGHTAQGDDGLDADDIVLVGSPGSNADHVSELGFAPDDVHTSTAENDGISMVTGFTHGPDPTAPGFGATVFDSDPGSEGGSWPLGDAHSEYFDRNSASLEYMGEVIAGQR
ncbi:alpha/beta hydrolase [Nocardiopsis alba]|uniref:alpha/beta hydrolase n=1 Tax=Nocardiopsis alba TaxID=53437 RepID=UPI00366AC087